MNDNAEDILFAIRTMSQKREYPCTSCHVADQHACTCPAWRKWFAREWSDIRKAAERERQRCKRNER